MISEVPTTTFDAVVLGVAHNEFLSLDMNLLRKKCSILYDVKGVLEDNVDGRL
jgi:UDP-N-acetyl-D-galactosamine dehydrogenase